MKQKSDVIERIVDIHCHILPGLDDGAKNMEETLAMLRIAAKEGITDIIATPHFKPEGYHAEPEAVLQGVMQVQEAAAIAHIPIRIYPGNEIFYFNGVEKLLEEGHVCTLGGSRAVLLEFYPYMPFSYLRTALDSVMNAGFLPVLAHAERYGCLMGRLENIRYLKARGVLIQVNAECIPGKGLAQKRFIRRLLKESLVDFIGTDAHDTRFRAPLIAKCTDMLIRKYGQDLAGLLLAENAQEILPEKDGKPQY